MKNLKIHELQYNILSEVIFDALVARLIVMKQFCISYWQNSGLETEQFDIASANDTKFLTASYKLCCKHRLTL